jgi:hypothetical protein
MNRFTHVRRALAVGVVAAAATLSMTQGANAKPADPEVPTALEPPAGDTVFLVGHAKGVQIYKCDGTTWQFVEPRAELVDDNGKPIITHFAGPTWQATDGSKVVGTRVAGVNVDPKAIDWLLLSAKRAVGSPDGLLANTTFIQRVETKNGTAPPAAACKAATVNKIHEVPYKSDYYFWRASA